MTPAELADALAVRLSADGSAWLAQGRAAVRADPAALGRLFPACGRRCGRGPLLGDRAGDDGDGWTVDDAARTLLLVDVIATAPPAAAAAELEAVYRHGDAAERRGALRALPVLDAADAAGDAADHTGVWRERAVAIVEDALRTNDTRLVRAALSPFAARHLPAASLAGAVLKWAFVGIHLGGLPDLPADAGPEIARLLAGFAHERIAAGRDVPADVWPLIDRDPPAVELAALEAELDHPTPDRRRAARRAFDARRATRR